MLGNRGQPSVVNRAAGRKLREDQPNGTYAGYAYDDAGRLLSIYNRRSDASLISKFEYTYDAVGNRLSMTDNWGTANYGYDAIYQLTSATYPEGRVVTYGYDAVGNRTQLNDKGVISTYTYNSDNELLTSACGGVTTTYGYDAAGNQTSKSVNGVTTTYTYDSRGKMSGVSTQAPSGSVSIPLKTGWNLISLPVIPTNTSVASVLASITGKYSHVWGYDGSTPSDPWRLYDPAKPDMSDHSTIEPDRGYYIKTTQDCVLTVSGSPITSDRHVSLQPGWNLIGWTTIVGRPVSNALSALSSDPQLAAWGYDETDATDHWKSYAVNEPGSDLVEFHHGNGYWVYVSNVANLTVPAPTPQNYHYDSQGRRLGNTVIYDGENQIAKYDDSGNLLVSYFQGPGIDNPISMTRNGQTYYYHTDALGSVTELTDSARSVMQSYRYDAFGAIVQQSGTIQNPFTYTGREFDKETGLYYYRARYYDAEVGRFLSPDPIVRSNRYIYATNNPVIFADPRGLQSEPKCVFLGFDYYNGEWKCGDPSGGWWVAEGTYWVIPNTTVMCQWRKYVKCSREQRQRERYVCFMRCIPYCTYGPWSESWNEYYDKRTDVTTETKGHIIGWHGSIAEIVCDYPSS